jgi:hypothetical protein
MAIIRLVTHHDDNGITSHMIEPTAHRSAEPMRGPVLHGSQAGNLGLERFEQPPSGIRAAIVNNNDLMRHVVSPKFEIEMFDCGYDAALLILSWDNDREQS